MVSRRKKVSSWNSVEPKTPQEVKADLPDVEPRPHGGSRRYKDTRNWCRGKIGGRRHTGVIEYGDRWGYNAHRVTTQGHSLHCYHGGYGPRTWYHCEHHEICSNPRCRKVLRWSLGTDCPDYGRWRVIWTRGEDGVPGYQVTDVTKE